MDYSYEGKCSGWELNPQNSGSKPDTYSIRLLEQAAHKVGTILHIGISDPSHICSQRHAGRLGLEPRPRILEIRMLPLHHQPRWEIISLYFYQHKFLFEHDN